MPLKVFVYMTISEIGIVFAENQNHATKLIEESIGKFFMIWEVKAEPRVYRIGKLAR